ncbi:hypothetical protein Tco_1232262, partial [Tanacetum coccineum]
MNYCTKIEKSIYNLAGTEISIHQLEWRFPLMRNIECQLTVRI